MYIFKLFESVASVKYHIYPRKRKKEVDNLKSLCRSIPQTITEELIWSNEHSYCDGDSKLSIKARG